MKNIIYMLSALGAVLFFCSIALANEFYSPIPNLVDDSVITLSGKVYRAGNENYFVLSTESGNITVVMPPDKPRSFDVGDNITATGVVNKVLWGIMGTELQASSVEINQHKQITYVRSSDQSEVQ